MFKFDRMLPVDKIIELERKGASMLQFKERTIEKVIGIGYRTANSAHALAVKVCHLAQSLEEWTTEQRLKLRNNKKATRARYFKYMQNLAEEQAKCRHESLALIALEKVKLEQEALGLEKAAQDYSYKM